MKEQIVKVRDIEVLEKLFEGYEDIISPKDVSEESTEEDEADFIRDIMSKNGLSFPFKVEKVLPIKHPLSTEAAMPGTIVTVLGHHAIRFEAFNTDIYPLFYDTKSWKLVR